MTTTVLSQFMSLFRGNERSFGIFDPKTKKMHTEKRVYTDEDFQNHLLGKMGIGIVPIRDDGLCYFGVIDIDAHEDNEEIDLKNLGARITGLELPLTLCRSKSGGAHLYFFGSEPLNAKLVVGLLTKWSIDLGFPGVEVFPKQTWLRTNEDNQKALGNWINLPYFNSDKTDRYAWESNGQSSLDLFLTNTDVRKVDQDELERLYSGEHPDAPPCIQKMLNGNVPKGFRNEALYSITVYLKRAFETNYREKAFDINNTAFSEPLPFVEAKKTISSASRRKYKYKCNEEPCKSLCNKEVCIHRKYGVTQGEIDDIEQYGNLPEFRNLKKYLTEPVRWDIDVDGVTVIMSTTILLDYRRVRERIADVLTRLIPPMTQKNWHKIIEKLMGEAQIIEVPDDASTAGVIRSKLSEFISKADLSSTGENVEDREALLRGMPVVQKDEVGRIVYFRGTDFVEFLKRTRSEEMKGVNLWFALRKAGVEHGRVRVKGVPKSVWSVKIGDEGNIELATPSFDPGF